MESELEKFDVCIVGAGPAGIICALEIARLMPSSKVALVNFGGQNESETNRLDDTIQLSSLRNHHSPYECTNKSFGGTSKTWGGRCVMYDEVDFIPRSTLGDNCTWDLGFFRSALPHVSRAAEYFECGFGPFDLSEFSSRPPKPIAEGFRADMFTDTRLERWSMPTRFGERYRGDIESSSQVSLFENLEARKLDVSAEGNVTSIDFFHSRTGDLTKIYANTFVVAAGAQESTRILLRNLQVFRALDSPPDALGKYYQGHVSGKIASVQFAGDPKLTEYGFGRDDDGAYYRRRFQPTKETVIENEILNTALWLDNPLYHDPAHKCGEMSLIYLAMISPGLGKRLAPPAIAASVTKGKRNKVSAHLLNVIRDLPGSVVNPVGKFYQRYCVSRKLPGIPIFHHSNEYSLHFHAEQIPRDSNRMYLGSDGETLCIDYTISDQDIESVIRTHQLLDDALQQSCSGKLRYWYPEDELASAISEMSRDGIHQNGTTRIAATSSEGVIDKDLKVFGTDNLYICSSSAFPTSGQANPTFFLGVTAVRLAHHLTGNTCSL